MKKTISAITAVAALALGTASSQAQWTYYDVVDGLYHSQSPLVSGGTANTFNALDGSEFTWSNDQASGDGVVGVTHGTWRHRTSGPGVPAYQEAFSGFYGNGTTTKDPNLYTLISGLSANTYYGVRVYSVFSNNSWDANGNQVFNNTRVGGQFSVDGGSTTIALDSRNPAYLIHAVDNSSGVGTDVVLTAKPSGDTRGYQETSLFVLSDASGVARVDWIIPQFISDGTAQDRWHIDGVALTTVPEPTSMALAGIGAAAMLIFRRRK